MGCTPHLIFLGVLPSSVKSKLVYIYKINLNYIARQIIAYKGKNLMQTADLSDTGNVYARMSQLNT